MYQCPVCGYDKLHYPPYDSDEGWGSDEICISCGFQFGCHDSVNIQLMADYVADDPIAEREKCFRLWREHWITNGCKWSTKYQQPPADWNPKKQLKSLEDKG